MCFSAEVSYAAAGILLPLGTVSIYKAYQTDRRYVAICTLPLLFGLQQLFEGLVWTGGEAGDMAAVAADPQQLHSDRRKFGQKPVIDLRFQCEVVAHQCLDPPGAIGRTLRCAVRDHGNLDIGKPNRHTIARRAFWAVDEMAIGTL